jgi:hypothetical protein
VRADGIIRKLLSVLPDSYHDGDDSWLWGWAELSDRAQEEVKEVRKAAQSYLERL